MWLIAKRLWKEIAANMNITVRTVKFFLAALFAKAGTLIKGSCCFGRSKRDELACGTRSIESKVSLGILSSLVPEKLVTSGRPLPY